MLPAVIGGKGLDLANNITSGVNQRSAFRLQAQYNIELAQLQLVSKAMDIAAGHIAEENHRKAIKLEMKDRQERHEQYMDTMDAFQKGVKEFRVTELPDEKQDDFHQTFLALIRSAPCLR